MKRKLYHYKLGFVGIFTLEQGIEFMNKQGGVFQWDKPIEEMIVGCLTSADELIEAETKKLELLKLHRKGLAQKLVPNNF